MIITYFNYDFGYKINDFLIRRDDQRKEAQAYILHRQKEECLLDDPDLEWIIDPGAESINVRRKSSGKISDRETVCRTFYEIKYNIRRGERKDG